MSKVLMYSGGLDSFIISRMFDFDTVVFAQLGNEDNEEEFNRMIADPFFNRGQVKVVSLPISQYELENKIIPYRNHMLALTGAQYGNQIYFGFTGGDTTKDKDFVFKSQMEGILNYFALDKHKVGHPDYPYTIKMPYKEVSKGQMVHAYLNAGNRMADLWTISRSCYAGAEKECGQCRSCQRKYVALLLNGVVDAGSIFQHAPTQEELIEFYEECANKGRFQQELDEIRTVIEQTYNKNTEFAQRCVRRTVQEWEDQ